MSSRLIALLLTCLLDSALASGSACLSLRGEPRRATEAAQEPETEHAEEIVDCFDGAKAAHAASQNLVLLTSSGFGTWGPNNSFVPEGNLLQAVRDLVLRLPDDSWPEDGASRKSQARARNTTEFAGHYWREPDLYGDLEVIVIDDPCFLQASFWDDSAPHFHEPLGLNYLTAGMTTSVELIRPYFPYLDGGWCVNFSSPAPGYLPALGFNPANIHHVGLWDALANDAEKVAVLNILKGGSLLGSSLARMANATAHRGPPSNRILELAQRAGVLVVNGGNPDFAKYVLTDFASNVFSQFTKRVLDGAVLYVGESAGSMVGSADIGLTIESTPNLLTALDQRRTSGLGLVGRCAIRPHYSNDLWDLTSNVYGRLKGFNVVRLPNGEALECVGCRCRIVGATGEQGPSVFTGPRDPHLERLVEAFNAGII